MRGLLRRSSVSDRAFDPFYTTKTHDQGTGMGLSMVHGFVEQSGGPIVIESELGRALRLASTFLFSGVRPVRFYAN